MAMYEFKQRYGFFYAEDREESEPCERGTVGCMVDHTKSPDHCVIAGERYEIDQANDRNRVPLGILLLNAALTAGIWAQRPDQPAHTYDPDPDLAAYNVGVCRVCGGPEHEGAKP